MLTQDQLLEKINAAIDALRYNAKPDALYEPIRYALSLGGKRIRPVLMLMAYQLYRFDVDTIMPQALALETYHNFTLLHDDVMDRAEVRRGIPCVHQVWGDNAAILSGDAMLILAYRLMTEQRTADDEDVWVNPSALTDALKTFTEATLGVCEGQQYDIDFERRNDVTVDEYMEMIRLKTSLLLGCALKIGAQLAGASATDAQSLYDYGEKVGLAFQLQDDLLDVYGDPVIFGKIIGGDILCNKKTFMLLSTQQRADAAQRQQLDMWLNAETFDADEKIASVRAIYDAVGIRRVCEQKIEELFAEALRCLDAVSVGEARTQALRDFSHHLMGRQS
ncbi:MAG: polyprenyl synthetase family protein [Bacteroidales bacterium]|nr:polyprenyl synthetase family protein [Bacteroidales bacterium]